MISINQKLTSWIHNMKSLNVQSFDQLSTHFPELENIIKTTNKYGQGTYPSKNTVTVRN